MKHLLALLLTFTIFIPSSVQAFYAGVQLPGDNAVYDLSQSEHGGAGWVKFQYALGSQQPLENWIGAANDNGYNVLVSVAKNYWGIPELGDPGADPCSEGGYAVFRDAMADLAGRLGGVGAVEVWNEPNIQNEWTEVGLGELSAERAAYFISCGAEGLRQGGFDGIIISAAPAPLTFNGPGSYDDTALIDALASTGAINSVDAVGWHSNVVANIPPDSDDMNGFQRYQLAAGLGKPVWITEFGWHRERAGIDEATQADYINQAFAIGTSDPSVEGMFVWNYGFGSLPGADPDFQFWDIAGIPGIAFPESSGVIRPTTTPPNSPSGIPIPSGLSSHEIAIQNLNKGLLPENLAYNIIKKDESLFSQIGNILSLITSLFGFEFLSDKGAFASRAELQQTAELPQEVKPNPEQNIMLQTDQNLASQSGIYAIQAPREITQDNSKTCHGERDYENITFPININPITKGKCI